MKKFVCTILLLMAVSLSRGQVVWHFLERYGYPMVEGEVNGKMGWFLIDTGTPLNFIFNSQYVPIENNRKIGMGRLSSGQQFELCRSDSACSFIVDETEFDSVMVCNGNLHFMEELTQMPLCLGFIGYGYLKDYKFALDYKEHTCTLFPIDSVDVVDTEVHPLLATVHFSVDEHKPQMPMTSGVVGTTPVSIVFDTGASTGWVKLNQRTNSELTASKCLSADKYGTYRLKNLFVGNLDAPTLKSLHYSISTVGNEIILSGEFLRHYITVWNYSNHTIEIYRNESSWFGLFL